MDGGMAGSGADHPRKLQADGKFKIDKEKNEARESAIVRNLLKGEKVVVVLDNAHDLGDKVQRNFEHVRVVVMRRKASPDYYIKE